MQKRYCFVAMPFRPELNFFYLYLKKYLEDSYDGLTIERGDANVLTKPVMEKIKDQIRKADLVIGDISGNNANVFYELGLAHASGKPVLFLCQGPPENAPVDVRQFEFIQYDLGRHEELLLKLDNAIRNAFGAEYKSLWEMSLLLLKKFNYETGLQCMPNKLEEFQALVMRGEQQNGIPSEDRQDLLAEFLLPKIISDFRDIQVIQKYLEWIKTIIPFQSP